MNSMSRKATMALGALMAYLAPKLAQDAKFDLVPVVEGVTAENFGERKAAMAESITTGTKDLLAADAKVDDLSSLLDALEKQPVAEDPVKKTPDGITQTAMDAAIGAAVDKAKADTKADVLKAQRETRAAEQAVRPYVGELTTAFDSADEVYKAALTGLGVKVDGIHPSAFPAILAAQPKPNSKKPTEVAMDAANTADFSKRFPDAARIVIN